MKTHAQTPANSVKFTLRLGWLRLIPLLVLHLPVQATGPELTIEQSTNGTCLLTWPVTTSDYVVMSATDVEGPWEPYLEHITEAAGMHSVTISASHPREYFRLVEGYYDDFEDGNLDGWTVAIADPEAPTYLDWECTNGHLRVYGDWPGSGLQRHVVFYRTNLVMTNFNMCIDILGWDDGVPGDQPKIVLVGRFHPTGIPDSYSYGGGVSMRYYANPNFSAIWLHKTWPGGMDILGYTTPIVKTDPAKDYRLAFQGVGSDLTVQFFNLTDATFVDQYEAADDMLTDGLVGFYVVVGGPNGSFDFTLDNFVAVAAAPQ